MHHLARRKFLKNAFTATGLGLLAAYGNFSNSESLAIVKTLANPALASSDAADWKLEVSGLVAQAHTFNLMNLKALPNCAHISEDGFFAAEEPRAWAVPLRELLSRVKPLKRARYVVMHYINNDSSHSISMHEAYHLQTMLVSQPNSDALASNTGAAPRLVLKQQFDTQVKYIRHIEVVDT
ncbi:MAG TPA: molybdopterin-dependent oxidoreductase [Methylotenera sp.]|nr:molybdopterin-dependent oxidoreductase [Methylotenera sp.]